MLHICKFALLCSAFLLGISRGVQALSEPDNGDVSLLQQSLEVHPDAYSDLQNEDFSLDGLRNSRNLSHCWHSERLYFNWTESEIQALSPSVSYLAVARTGSETINITLGLAGQCWHHEHHCTLTQLSGRGVDKIIVSLRNPEDRLISGWEHPGNADLHAFASLDGFVLALKNMSHAQHGLAMRAAYGADEEECQGLDCYDRSRPQFLLPVAEFYFHGSSAADLEKVMFVCTRTLNEDVQSTFAALDIDLPEESLTVHANPPKDTPPQRLSQESLEWLRRTYKADYDLVTRHCNA